DDSTWCWGILASLYSAMIRPVRMDWDAWDDLAFGQDGSACRIRDGAIACNADLTTSFEDLYPNLRLSWEPRALGESATRIVAGNEHFCVLTTGRHVACWGSNLLAQLGSPHLGFNPSAVITTLPSP